MTKVVSRKVLRISISLLLLVSGSAGLHAQGIITTMAGTGWPSFSGDGGPATAAMLANPQVPTVDASGNVYFADAGNFRIRKITPDGTISTVAGNGIRGTTG